MKRSKKEPRERDQLERFIDRHNHKLEVIRTIGSIVAALTGFLVFLKVFEII
jgi:hypothetical protein